MIHLGFDPGTTGAFCMLTPAPDWRCEVRDLPVVLREGKKRTTKHVDAAKLEAVLRELVPSGHRVLATVEDVFTIPGKGSNVHSTDSLVESRSTVEAVCRILGYTVDRVRPQTWQKFYGLSGKRDSTARASVEAALRLYPHADLRLVKHHNRAEALLIAHHARRMAA